MLEIRLKPEAEVDLEKIYEYTVREWGIAQANRYQDDLFEAFLLIAKQQDLGKQYPFANIPYRKLHVNRHLIFYRIEDLCCIVVRILHDRMDIRKQLK